MPRRQSFLMKRSLQFLNPQMAGTLLGPSHLLHRSNNRREILGVEGSALSDVLRGAHSDRDANQHAKRQRPALTAGASIRKMKISESAKTPAPPVTAWRDIFSTVIRPDPEARVAIIPP